jgi:hypothetical protein
MAPRPKRISACAALVSIAAMIAGVADKAALSSVHSPQAYQPHIGGSFTKPILQITLRKGI